jgi:hypothetical protein
MADQGRDGLPSPWLIKRHIQVGAALHHRPRFMAAWWICYLYFFQDYIGFDTDVTSPGNARRQHSKHEFFENPPGNTKKSTLL